MNTQNFKTFPGYVVSTELTGGYRVFKEEFDHAYALMTIAAKDDVSDLVVASAMLGFSAEPVEEDDSVVCVTPVDNLLRAWIFHDVTTAQYEKITVAAKFNLLSPKDAVAFDIQDITLDPNPADPTYTIVAETESGQQVIVREPHELK